VRNWLVVLEMAQGNFARLFIPGSPAFLLAYVPVALFTHSFLVFQTINALLAVVGLGLFAACVARVAKLTGPEVAGLTLLAGTGLLLTFSGRDFTTSSISLVVFAMLLQSHFARLHRPSTSAFLRGVAWQAVGLSFNYKFLFTLPILLVLEVWQADGLWRQRGVWWRALLILVAPYVLFGTLGVAVGLPWHRWLAFYTRTAVPVAANVAGRQAAFQFDPFYYLRYLMNFESPLLLVGLVLAVWLVGRSGWQHLRSRPLPLLAYLLAWAGCTLAGMSLLVKAPRGLLFAYLPLAALAVLGSRRMLPGWALLSVLLAAVGLNVFRIQRELFAPLPSHYPAVAAWLQQHGATRVASTVGMGLAPYLNKAQTLTVITDERQLAGLRHRGYQYVLLDGYWRVAGVARFDSLRRQVPAATWAAPQLQRPLLFLEHSEYVGTGYAQTLVAARAAAADTLSLRLYRLR
jgi:hypothetical protein